MGTTLWQLDSPSALVAQCAAACIAVLCADPIDGFSCSTTAIKLGGVPRLRRLAGLDVTTGEERTEPTEVCTAALDALEAIALAEKLMAEFEEEQSQKLAAQEEQALAEVGNKESGS